MPDGPRRPKESESKQDRVWPAAGLGKRAWGVIGLLGIANFFDHYDLGLLSLVIPRLQADFGIAEEELGFAMAVIRLGVLPAILLAVASDRIGRRPLLFATIAGFSVCTLLSAFPTQLYQLLALRIRPANHVADGACGIC